jgi:hypothetical protein
MKKISTLILVSTIILLAFSQCKRDCKPSTMDCSTIKYQCLPGEEVCGCDGVTYNCALDAECRGRISEYKEGKCK